MRFVVALVMMLALACSGPAGGSYSLDDASADVVASAPWEGVYVATIAATLRVGDVVRNAPGADTITITQDASRVTWVREGDCRVVWSASGSSATADAGQQCAFVVGGSAVALRLEMGAANISGAVLTATLRWSTVGSGGLYTETITATRR